MKVVLGAEAPRDRSSGDSGVQIHYMNNPPEAFTGMKLWTVLIVCNYNLEGTRIQFG